MLASTTALLAGAGATADSGSVTKAQAPTASQQAAHKAALRWMNDRAQNVAQAAWHWDDVLGRPHVHFGYQPGSSQSVKYLKWVLKRHIAVSHRLHKEAKRKMVRQTRVLMATAARLRLELGLTDSSRSLQDAGGIEARRNFARRLVKHLSVRWHKSGLLQAFTCIHGGEGAWNANTGNGYYGGLQMDIPFQSRYGPEFLEQYGTADHWPIWAQVAAAVRAYKSGRGFGPWPNTARACGLI